MTWYKLGFRRYQTCLFVILLFLGSNTLLPHRCTTTSKNLLTRNQDDFCLNLHKNYSDFILDSNLLFSYFQTNDVSPNTQKEVLAFYNHRDYQFAWFNQCGMISASASFDNLLSNYQNEFEDPSLHNVILETMIHAAMENEEEFLKDWTQVTKLEILLTVSFFKYADKVYGGIVGNTTKLSWYIPRKKKDYKILLDSLVFSNSHYTFVEPLNPIYAKLKRKLIEYKKIDKSGIYPIAVIDKNKLVLGDTDRGLVAIKKQLLILGDIKIMDTNSIFTNSLAAGIQNFQLRMGLSQSGIIDQKTLAQLNKPISDRIKQIVLNLERLRWIPSEMPSNFLLVNIPEYKLHVIEKGKQVFDMNVIVGKAMNKTVIFEGTISSIVLNPYWNIPNSIVQKEILRLIDRDPNYLNKNNMERIYNIESNTYVYRQKPGDKNALGKIKFLFPNHYNIYLHDAPAKSLFEATNRAFSHGCIRVADAKKLALYILNKQEFWTDERLTTELSTNEEKPIAINPTIPVYIVYFTTWIDHSGAIQFRNDIYGLDKQLEIELFGN